MLIIENFAQVAAQIESERGITKEALIDAIQQALISACKRNFKENVLLDAKIDELTGKATILQQKKVVAKVEDSEIEISLADAKKKKKSAKLDSIIEFDVTPKDFGRIAAQTAKQVIIQRIREAEKSSVFDDFTSKEGTIITGTVQRIENNNYLINLGRVEAILTPGNQIPGENYKVKDKIRVYIVAVRKKTKGPFIQISRTHTGLLQKLFELEIPEIQDKIIEVKSVSREPGKRAKVAVKSNNPAIGAVGTCVGHMGNRIQAIIREIGKEKIDILEWNEDAKIFIANALKPAEIRQVILNEKEKTASVIVNKDQLSLAIGKEGINVKLAVRLTGWKLDIFTDDQAKPQESKNDEKLTMAEKIKRDTEKMKIEAEQKESKLLLAKEAKQPETVEKTEIAEEKKKVTKVKKIAKVEKEKKTSPKKEKTASPVKKKPKK